MIADDDDRESWIAARGRGRDHFIEERSWSVGVRLGLALAAWNATIAAAAGGDALNRVLLESVYFLSGSIVLTGLSALLEWKFLERRFGA